MRNFNGRLYEVCDECGNIVCVNKPLFGSVHLCSTVAERRDNAREIARRVAAARVKLKEAK